MPNTLGNTNKFNLVAPGNIWTGWKSVTLPIGCPWIYKDPANPLKFNGFGVGLSTSICNATPAPWTPSPTGTNCKLFNVLALVQKYQAAKPAAPISNGV